MKRLLTLSLFSLFLLGTPKTINAQEASISNLCFTDGFGIVYFFPTLSRTGPGVYTGTGTSNAYASTTVKLKLTLSSPSSGTLEMKVINDNPDGCTSFSDGYVYIGTVAISMSGGHPVGTGSGTWQSYCSGTVINSGTWTASGPCASPASKPSGINPTSGSQKIKDASTAISNLCFTDGFGIVYFFPTLSRTGPGVYTGTGTSNAYASTTVKLKLTLSSSSSGTLEMKVINDNPDGCTSFSDGYVYIGTVAISMSGGHPVGTGSGTWQSYCSGTVINSGTWTASGPCASPASKPSGINPASGSQKIKESSISITPNPVVNQTKLTYVVANPGKVNITIYNAMQQPVKILVNQMQAAGSYSVSWNTLNSAGSAVPNGVYKVVAAIGKEIYTNSIQVVR